MPRSNAPPSNGQHGCESSHNPARNSLDGPEHHRIQVFDENAVARNHRISVRGRGRHFEPRHLVVGLRVGYKDDEFRGGRQGEQHRSRIHHRPETTSTTSAARRNADFPVGDWPVGKPALPRRLVCVILSLDRWVRLPPAVRGCVHPGASRCRHHPLEAQLHRCGRGIAIHAALGEHVRE